MPAALVHPNVVLHMLHAGHRLRNLLGKSPFVAAVCGTRKRDLLIANPHLDLRGIDERIVREPVADILADAVVGSCLILRAAASPLIHFTPPLRFIITEPGRHLIACLVPPTAFAAPTVILLPGAAG